MPNMGTPEYPRMRAARLKPSIFSREGRRVMATFLTTLAPVRVARAREIEEAVNGEAGASIKAAYGDGYDEGYRAGIEAMREAAVAYHDDRADLALSIADAMPMSADKRDIQHAAGQHREYAAAIRALEVK